jgi:hypothetical protein
MSCIRLDASRLAGLCGKQTINALRVIMSPSACAFRGFLVPMRSPRGWIVWSVARALFDRRYLAAVFFMQMRMRGLAMISVRWRRASARVSPPVLVVVCFWLSGFCGGTRYLLAHDHAPAASGVDHVMSVTRQQDQAQPEDLRLYQIHQRQRRTVTTVNPALRHRRRSTEQTGVTSSSPPALACRESSH